MFQEDGQNRNVVDIRILRAINYMTANLDQHLSLASLAAHSGLSACHFARLFKTETGMSPMAFLKHLRFEAARTLLTSTSLTIKEIVPRVGLDDPSHFVRSFKKLYQVTPAQSRKRKVPVVDLNLIPQIRSK